MPVVLVEQYCDCARELMDDNYDIDSEEAVITGTTSIMVEVNVY